MVRLVVSEPRVVVECLFASFIARPVVGTLESLGAVDGVLDCQNRAPDLSAKELVHNCQFLLRFVEGHCQGQAADLIKAGLELYRVAKLRREFAERKRLHRWNREVVRFSVFTFHSVLSLSLTRTWWCDRVLRHGAKEDSSWSGMRDGLNNSRREDRSADVEEGLKSRKETEDVARYEEDVVSTGEVQDGYGNAGVVGDDDWASVDSSCEKGGREKKYLEDWSHRADNGKCEGDVP